MKQKNKKGSLTVETALLLPAAVSIILFFLHLFRILWAEQQLTYAGLEVMQTVSDCGYLLKYAMWYSFHFKCDVMRSFPLTARLLSVQGESICHPARYNG